MPKDTSKPWPNHPLLDVESKEIEIQRGDVQTMAIRGHSCVVGKLVADHYVSKETIKSSLLRWWKPMEAITFKVLGENLFLIEFVSTRDKARVLEGRLWVFEGALFLVDDFKG